MHDLGTATRAMAEVITGIRDDQLGAPTPCPAYTLGDLLEHVDGLTLAFAMAARKELPASDGPPPPGDATRLAGGWRTRIPEQLDALARAWRAPDAWTGDTAAGGVPMDGATCALVATNEVVVHGWDLAVATGQRLVVDAETVAPALAFVGFFSGPGTEEMRGDAFGPEVAPPSDASELERLVALSGRNPRWQP
ncbi:TIGR03086 family metal-binding protein [Nocardioides jensenii]|uniref:TIGR03086 family metal-binding protein n=1 Tax=Nocardioides jensenii TaxID=1843 RepID=UPI00082D03E4|nr:TIGR03086 family metal-binding protein [Nocardioides jensenii]